MSLPSFSEFSKSSKDQQTHVLAQLFEPCPVLVDFIQKKVMNTQVSSYEELIESTRKNLASFLCSEHSKPRVSKDVSAIISAHPRLGPLKNALSSHSSAEQRSLAGLEEEAERLRQLNDRYEKQFPGLRFVVYVNGRSRDAIMEIMKQRIDRGDIRAERREAFEAMCDIALDRAAKLGLTSSSKL